MKLSERLRNKLEIVKNESERKTRQIGNITQREKYLLFVTIIAL